MLLRAMLSKDEAELMWRHYKEKQDLRLIADSMGISYTTAKQWHKRSLKMMWAAMVERQEDELCRVKTKMDQEKK